MRRPWLALALVLLLTATSGCRGSFVDVARGRPQDADAGLVNSDFDENKQPTGWERFAPENIGKTMKSAVGYGPNEKVARDAFDEGMKLFAAQDYDKAAKQFATAADRWPDSTLEEDAMFMQGESAFFANRYSGADDQYGELMKKYPNTKHLDMVVTHEFAIGRYWQEIDVAHHHWELTPNFTDRTRPLFDTGGHGITAMDAVRVNDPHGYLADAATMAEANTYFQKHRYEDADYYYGVLREQFPKSKFQYQAHLLGLQCKMQKYQGPYYNGKPLEEAEKLIDQMLVQFPDELSRDHDERDRLVKAKAEMRAQKANRDIQLAQYFDNGEHYGAAKIYYAQVIKDYPQTQFAEAAKTRMAALEGKPDDPPNRFAFLTDWSKPKDTHQEPATTSSSPTVTASTPTNTAAAPADGTNR
ncbi:MAG TPA: outer membrane protein assembly factor BamD [Pirellulales bacterium]